MWQKVFFLGYGKPFESSVLSTADQGDADVPQASPSSRHTEKVKAVREGRHDLVLIGDSITLPGGTRRQVSLRPFKAVWDQVFAPLNAINLGFNGYRTEQILWNLQQGQLDFEVSPRRSCCSLERTIPMIVIFPRPTPLKKSFEAPQAIVDLILKRHPASRSSDAHLPQRRG